MQCRTIQFSSHAIIRMFERSLSVKTVERVVHEGEVIADYPDDTPYPSQLLLHSANGIPLHVVVAFNKNEDECIVVTAYVPSPNQWEAGFRKRKRK